MSQKQHKPSPALTHQQLLDRAIKASNRYAAAETEKLSAFDRALLADVKPSQLSEVTGLTARYFQKRAEADTSEKRPNSTGSQGSPSFVTDEQAGYDAGSRWGKLLKGIPAKLPTGGWGVRVLDPFGNREAGQVIGVRVTAKDWSSWEDIVEVQWVQGTLGTGSRKAYGVSLASSDRRTFKDQPQWTYAERQRMSETQEGSDIF